MIFPELSTSLANKSESLEKPLKEIKIYPNPVKNQIQIIVKNLETATLNVYDLEGKIVYSGEIKNENSIIDFTKFSNGIYLFKIINENGDVLKTEKVVKE